MLRFDEETAEELANHSRCIHSLLVATKEVALSIVTSDANVHHLIRLVTVAEAELDRHIDRVNRALSSAERITPLAALP